MRKLVLVLSATILCSCSSAELTTELTMGRFSTHPYGQEAKLKTKQQQSGDVIEGKLTKDNFKEVTVAQGSGLDGFDTIRLFADGSGYVVFS